MMSPDPDLAASTGRVESAAAPPVAADRLAIPPGMLAWLADPRRLALAVFLAVWAMFAVLQAVWSHELAQPAVTLLGAGDSLSVLVTAGNARLLIANGDDGEEFRTALGLMQRPTLHRLDVLLLNGDAGSAPVAAAAYPGLAPRAAFLLTPLAPGDETPALAPLPVLSGNRRIGLGSMDVLLEVTPRRSETDAEAGAEADQVVDWRAVINRDAASVVVLSDSAAARAFPPVAGAAVLVVLAGDPVKAWHDAPAPVLVVPDTLLKPDAARSWIQEAEHPTHIVRVFPGEAEAFAFTAAGLSWSATNTLTRPPATP